MRKISLLAAAAAICISAPVLAKGGSNNGKSGASGQGSGGSNGNSNGQGNGGSQGAGNSQSGGNGQGGGAGNSGNGGGPGNGQSQGHSDHGGDDGNTGGSQGAGGGQSSGNGQGAGAGNGGGTGLGSGQSQSNSDGIGNGGNAGGNGGNGGGGTISQPVACGLHDLSIPASACSGFYSGNLLDNKDVAAQVAGLALVGFSWDGDFNKLVDAGQKIDGNGATEISFGKELIGLTVVGIHFGGGGPDGVGNGTAFYSFDARAGIKTLGLNYPGSSGIVLYSTNHPTLPNPPVPPGNDTGSVPEPSSWALMIGGFGMVGYAMRRRGGVVATA